MNAILISLGFTLLHSLWQGIIIALLVKWLANNFKSSSARYNIYLSALPLMVIVSIATFLHYVGNISFISGTVSGASADGVVMTIESLSSPASPLLLVMNYFLWMIPYLPLIWFAGVIFFSLRLSYGLWLVNELKTKNNFPVESSIQKIFNETLRKAGCVQNVKIFESSKVSVPVVIGNLKSVVLLPFEFATGLTSSQVEAVLAHEIAHIMRKDFMVNIFQSVFDVIYFYHPALRWISEKVREEREYCCDDLALEIVHDRINYAKTIYSLRLKRSLYKNAIAANGNNENLLLKRVKRILGENLQTQKTSPFVVVSLLLIITFSCVLFTADARNEDVKDKVEKATSEDPGFTLPEMVIVGEKPKRESNILSLSQHPLLIKEKIVDEDTTTKKNRVIIMNFSDGDNDTIIMNMKMDNFAIEMEKLGKDLSKNMVIFENNMKIFEDTMFWRRFDTLSYKDVYFKHKDFDEMFSDKRMKIFYDEKKISQIEKKALERMKELNEKERKIYRHQRNTLKDDVKKKEDNKILEQIKKDNLAGGEIKSVEITDKEMKVNGKKQTADVHKKYLSMAKEMSGMGDNKGNFQLIWKFK